MPCHICNASPARKVNIAITSVSNSGNDVGVSHEIEVCDVHRLETYDTLKTQSVTELEAAIAA